MSAEGKIDFLDDLAVVYLGYGPGCLMKAMESLRQSSERRPQIVLIRQECQKVAASSKAQVASAPAREMAEYHARIRSNPEEFIPLALLMRDSAQLVKLRRKCREQGIPIDPGEQEKWIEWRMLETEKEWAGMIAAGRLKASEPKPDGRGGAFSTPGQIATTASLF